MVGQNDVTVMRSYLEVDIAEWLSENKVPFAYEGFTIPSVVGPTKDDWDLMVKAVRAVGRNEFDEYDRITQGTPWEDRRPAEVLGDWNEVYDKHRLQGEHITIPVQQALSQFDKQLMLPDFALYMDFDGKQAPDGFDYGSYTHIMEVSGLYGVGIPEEADESDWWDWYRVSAVAFKEFAYRMLGLWDDVLWIVPNQDVSDDNEDGLPRSVVNDDRYIIMNSTMSELGLDGLEDALGITAEPISNALSPPIEPVAYKRGIPQAGDIEAGEMEKVMHEFDGVNLENVDENENAVILEDNWLVYHGKIGEVYIHNGHAHVRESMWRRYNMILLREYILATLMDLEEDGIVQGLRESQ